MVRRPVGGGLRSDREIRGHATVRACLFYEEAFGLLRPRYRELRAAGIESALLVLLESKDEGVTAWAGAHALEFAPEQGEPVLAKLAESPGLLGFGAQITLREWCAGSPYVPLAGESLVCASVQE